MVQTCLSTTAPRQVSPTHRGTHQFLENSTETHHPTAPQLGLRNRLGHGQRPHTSTVLVSGNRQHSVLPDSVRPRPPNPRRHHSPKTALVTTTHRTASATDNPDGRNRTSATTACRETVPDSLGRDTTDGRATTAWTAGDYPRMTRLRVGGRYLPEMAGRVPSERRHRWADCG